VAESPGIGRPRRPLRLRGEVKRLERVVPWVLGSVGALVAGWAAVRMPLLAAAGAVMLAVGLALFLSLRASFLVFLVLVPFSSATALPGHPELSLTKLALVILLTSWARERLSGTLAPTPKGAWGALLAVFVGTCVLSLTASVDLLRSVIALGRLLMFCGLAAAVADILRSADLLRRARSVILITAVPVAAFGIYQFVSGKTVLGLGVHPDLGHMVWWQGLTQASSVFDHPNVFATYLLVYIALAGAAFLTQRKAWALPLLALLMAAMLASLSRSGWIGLLATGAVLMLSRKRVLKIVPVAVAAALLLFAVLPEETQKGVLDRFTPRMDKSARARVLAYRSAMRMIARHPVVGVGLGNFPTIFLDYKMPLARFPKNFMPGATGMEAHNTFISIWAETGPLGLVSFCALIAVALLHYGRICRRKPEMLGWAAAFVGVAVQSFFNNQHYEKMLWLLMGVALALSGATTRAIPAHPPTEVRESADSAPAPSQS
jgi:O-antigen ligase